MSGSLCLDVNECAGNSSLCPVHASCVNLAGYYKCVCDAGFVNQSGICADLDECTVVDSCPPYSICNNTYGSYQCNCREGFQEVGVLCKDIDECTANICPQNGVCHNSVGSYYCTCKPGYQMQGLLCIDKNECTQEINVCQLHANCTNTDGSYRCTCMTGFSEMSGLCTDIDECTLSQICPVHASCTNMLGSYTCTCQDGYYKENNTCLDVDECLNSPCSGHANCSNMFGNYACMCNEGYHMINQACQDINECLSSPCLAHSTCENFGGGYKCTCVIGYSKGLTGICTDVNECLSRPCGNFEDCINTAGSYHCDCMDGYVKAESGTCSDEDECSAVISPCPANSNCLNLPGIFHCVCHNGYYQAGPMNCIESRVFKVHARVTHLDGVEVFHSAVYDNQSSVNTTHFMDRFDSAILVILNSTSLGRGYLGQRIYNISAGSLVIDGYIYYNISSPIMDSQLQAALSANATLYQATGLLVDLSQTYVTDVDECQQRDWNECSVYANCSNTVGSYNCTCFGGYLDISPDPSKPGRICAVISEVNQDPIKGLKIMANEPAFALGKMVTFTATMERGSHVNYKIQYGDGIIAVALNPDQLAFRMPYNFSHSYNIVGNFTVILFASNNISNGSASMNMIVQHNLVATSLTLTSTELDLVYSGDLNLMIMPSSMSLMFNNVHLTWNFGDGQSSFSYLDQINSTNVFVTRHEYGLGEFTLITNISNLVSWVTLTKSFFVEELITGLEVSATPTILKPNDVMTLIISTATGSNITLEINNGNRNKEMFLLNNIRRGSYMHIMTIAYDRPGEYNVTINAKNVKSNIAYALPNTIFVQNPVEDLVARVDPFIAVPSSVISLNITYPKNVSTAPTSVTCDTFLNDQWKTTQFIQNITNIKPLLIHVNASGFLDEVKVSGNCSNKLSFQIFQAWTVLQSVVSGVYIESDKLYIPVDSTVNFKFHVGGGSHVSYEYIFGNDLPRTGVLPSQIYLDYIMNDSYTYGLPGFYSLKFTAKNLVSQITSNITIGVLEEIKGLTLSRFYYPSDINKTQNFGHGDSGNIFPLERTLVLSCFVLSGNDVIYMIDFGNGQNVSTRNLTVFYKYRTPGTYTVTVNASNSLYWQQKNFTIEVYQTIQLYLLRNNGPTEAYLLLNLTLSLSRVGTNSCLLWNFGDNSTPVLYGGYSCMQEAGNTGYTYREWNGSIVLTHSHMYQKNGTFTVTVNGFNKVSTASITNIVLITGISCFYPIVHFIGGGQVIDNPVTTLLSDWVSLESTAVINCTATKSAKYKWKIFRVVQGPTYLDISYQEFNVDIAQTDRLKIYFRPRTLDIGLFKIVINVSMAGIPGLYSEDYQYLRVIPSPLVAKIKGGNARAVGYGKTFTLNAQDESYDPDVDVTNKTDFVYEWWCRQEWETFSESAIDEIRIPAVDEMYNLTREGGCFGTGIGKLPVSEGIFELSSLLLQPNSTNIFHLILCKGDRKTVFEQSIQIVLGDPPDFFLRCVVNCRSKVNPSSEFGMVSNCTVCHPLDNIKYLWSLYLQRKDSVEFDLVPNLQSLLATNITGVGIVFKPRTLIGGRLYKLRLDAVMYGYTPTFTEYKFITNLPPYRGKCKIEPETGYAIQTQFQILCWDWLNPGEEEARGEGLLYRFWTSPQGSNNDQLLYYGTDPFTPDTQFPLGVEDFNYMHNVVVTIANSIGEYVETNLTVQVKPAGTDNLDLMINMTSGDSNIIQNMLQSGKDQEVKQWFVAVASLINKNVSVIASTSTTTKTTTTTTVTPVPSSSSNISELVKHYTSLLPVSTTKVTTRATTMTSVATTTLSPEELARRKQAEEEDKRKRTVLRTMIVNQLALTQTHTMDALQQTAMAFKVITNKVDEISEESQNTTVSVMQRVADQYTNMIDESRSDSIGQEITAAGDLLASLGNIILAATIKTVEQIKEQNTQESYEQLSGTDLNVGTNVKQTSLYSKVEETVQTDNQTGQKAKQIALQAFDVADKIIKSLFKKQTPGQTPIVMNTQTISIIAKREELKKIDAALLETKLGMFQLPSKDSLQLGNNTGSFIDFSVKSFNSNPFVWDNSAKFINTPVISLDLFNDTGGKILVHEISEPIEIDVSVDPSTIRVLYVDGDYADNQTMKYHLFRVRSNYSSLNVVIKPTGTNASFIVYVTFGRYPSENDYDLIEVIPKTVPLNFSSIKEHMREQVEDEKKYTVHIPVNFIQQFGTGIYYIGISEYVDNTTNPLDDLSEYFDYMSENVDKSRLSSNYTISFVTSGCFYWNENLEQWKTDGCDISPVSNSYFTRCICNHLTSFGAEFFVPPNTINFRTVFSNLDQKIQDNYAVLTMLCVIMFLYIIGLIYTRHKDKQDIERWGVSPLADNVTTDQYYYQLTVVTGMRRGAGTKSNVSFVLSGDYTDTGVRLLKDEKGHKQLCRGSVNQYVMSVPEPLGPLVYLRVWHDNSGDGKNQGWYLSKIVVTDLQTGEVFVFLCKRWLAVEEDDGMVDRLLPVASHEDLTNFNNIFFSSTKKKLTDSHLWISIFSRPHRSSFTRVQRLSCILSLLMTTMLASAMFFLAEERVENAQAFVLGPFKFTLHEGYISIVCSLIVLPVNIAIDQIFRRSVPKQNFVENAFLVEKHVSMLSKFQMNLSLILNSQTKVMAMSTKPTDGEDDFDSDDDEDDFEDEVPSPESPDSLQSARSLSEYPCLDVPISPHPSSDQLKRSSSVILKVPQKMQPALFPGSTKRPTFTSWKTSIEEEEEEEESISLEPGKRSISPYLEVPRFPRVERKRIHSTCMSKRFIFPSLQVPQPQGAQSVLDAKQQFKQLFEKEQRELPSPSHSDETAFSFSSHHSDDMLIRPNSRAMSPLSGMKRKKTRTLPFWCVYIAWFLVFFSSGVSAFLTFLYSMEWGREKSLAWLTSMILSITESVFVIQPFKIILLVIFVAAILKKPEEEEEEEEERDPALLRPKSDEEIVVRPPTQALRPSLHIEPPNPEELAKAREKRLNELKMHRILREIFFYMLYLALLILVASHNRDSNSFRTGETIRNLLLSSQYDLQKVNTASGFWQWMNNVLVPSLYLSNLYNGQPAGDTEQRMIGSEVAYRVGPVRLRQQRVQQEECRCPPVMNLFIETCSVDWGFGLDDETTYDENWKPLGPLQDISKIPNYPWKYWSMMDVEGIPYAGQRGVYHGGGYIADLIGKKSNVQDMLATLEKNSWIDRYTRVIFVEFTVYNPNINLFTTVFIVMETPTTGSFIPEARVNTFRLFSYLGGYGVFVILCELSALACVLYFLGREIKSFRQEGRMYFMSFWNCMELSSLCGSLVSVVMYLMRHALTTYTVQKVTKLRVKFHSFQRIAMWDELFGIFLAFTIFLSILKLIHLFRFNRRMSLLATTLQLSAKELSGFSVVFTFFMIAYASWAYMMFGSKMEDFSSMISTFESLLTLVIGGFDFLTLQNINLVFGPIFVFSFILFIVFVLTNMFITIMNESFIIARKDISKQSNEYEIVSFMWDHFKAWTGIDFDKIFRDVRRKYLKESLTDEEELQYNFDDLETKLDNITLRLETLMETWNQPSPKLLQRNQCRAITPVSRSGTPFFTGLFPTLRMPGFSDA